MPTPINLSSANQEAYRAQVASSRSEKQLASMTNSLKSTEKMAKAMGLDTAGIQNTLKTVSASQEPASSFDQSQPERRRCRQITSRAPGASCIADRNIPC